MKRELFNGHGADSLSQRIPILLPLEILYDLTPRIWNSDGHNADIMSIGSWSNEAVKRHSLGFMVVIERGALALFCLDS